MVKYTASIFFLTVDCTFTALLAGPYSLKKWDDWRTGENLASFHEAGRHLTPCNQEEKREQKKPGLRVSQNKRI